jgi:hypothetical protein
MRISLQDASTQPAESYLYRVEQSGINQRLVEGIKRSPDSRQCRKGGCRGMSTLLTIANKKRQNIARIASDPWKKLFENLAISTQHSALHGTTTPDLDRSAPDYLTQQVKSALAGARSRRSLTMTICCAAIFAPRGIRELRPSADPLSHG